MLLAPLSLEPKDVHGLHVRFVEVGSVLDSFSSRAHNKLLAGEGMTAPTVPLLDFRARRKRDLFAFVDHLHPHPLQVSA
jgi:hypothetical protein